MSPDLRATFHENLDELCSDWSPEMTWRRVYDSSVFCVKYANTVGKRVILDKPHKYEGYVNKRRIADFEAHEIETIYDWLTYDEYMSLPEKEKKLHRYYQWDEPYDEYSIYRTIYERLCAMLYWFDYADAFEDRGVYWRAEPGLSDVRLFIERC